MILASLERSSRCAVSTAVTMAPSNADRSQDSSVTRNLRARLKNADGCFDALTAITCLGVVEAVGAAAEVVELVVVEEVEMADVAVAVFVGAAADDDGGEEVTAGVSSSAETGTCEPEGACGDPEAVR